MKRLIFLILLMPVVCQAAVLYNRDIYGIDERQFHRSSVENIVLPGLDHGGLGGLGDQIDHTWALYEDGTNPLAGAWDMGTQILTNVNIDTGDIANAVTHTEWDAAYTHVSNDGSDHNFIDQSVVSGASPTLDGTNFTGVPAGALDDTYVNVDGLVPMTANWDIGNFTLTANGLTIDGTFTDGTATLTDGDWTAIDDLTMGTATVNTGVFSMIQGGVASDPTFSITLAGDNAYIDQTIGDLYLASDGTIFFDNPLYTNQIATFGGTYVDYLQDLGDMDIGSVTVNGGNFQMTQGEVAGDPTFTITQSGNDVAINQTIGDMTITAGGGDIDFGDENLATDGTLEASGITSSDGDIEVENRADASAQLMLDAASGRVAQIRFEENDIINWVIRSAAGGGSDFTIRRFDDSGDPCDVPLTIDGPTGNVTLLYDLSAANITAVTDITVGGLLTVEGHAVSLGSTDSDVDVIITFHGNSFTGTLTYEPDQARFDFGDSRILTTNNIVVGAITSTGSSFFDSPTLVVNSTTHRVGIGTPNPDQYLEVYGVSPIIRIRATGDIGSAAAYVEFGRTTDGDWVRTGYVGDGISSNEDIYLVAEENDLKLGDSSSNAVLTLSGGDATFTGDVRIGTASDMLAPLDITGNATNVGDRHEGIWLRGKTGDNIVQINVRGSKLEIGGGGSLDATPAMSVDYITGGVTLDGGYLRFSTDAITAGARLSFKTDTITPSITGIWEIADNAANRITTDFGISVVLDPDPDLGMGQVNGAGYFTVLPSGTVNSNAGSSQIIGLFGGVAGSITNVSSNSDWPILYGLLFDVANAGDVIGKIGAGNNTSVRFGANITSWLGNSGDTVGPDKAQVLNTTGYFEAIMAGTFNATDSPAAPADSSNIAVHAVTSTSSWTDTAGVVNSYGVKIEIAADDSVINSYGIYQTEAGVSSGNVLESLTRLGSSANNMIVSSTGDTYWTGTGGLAYGGMFLHSGGVTIDCVGGNFIKITGLGSVGLLNNVTYNASALSVDKVGVYLVNYSGDADAAAINKEFEFAVHLNNVEVQQGSDRKHSTPTAHDEFHFSGTCLIDVTNTAHDIDLRIRNITDDTDIDILDVAFNIIQVGGT